MKTIIRPVSELSKKMSDIESFCIDQDTPIHLTKNGSNHMVIMSSKHYEMMLSKIAMYEDLLASEAQIRRSESLPAEVAVGALHEYLEEISNANTSRKVQS